MYSDTDSDEIPELGKEGEAGSSKNAVREAEITQSSIAGVGKKSSMASSTHSKKKIAPTQETEEPRPEKPRSAPLAGNTLGTVGFKWRVRIVRVYDSEEQWKGVVEIYFHWNLDRRNSISRKEVAIPESPTQPAAAPRARRMSVSAMTNPVNNIGMDMIDEPKVHPVFIILNDEESHCTEEVYYKVHNQPTMLFGYVSYTVAVHERLELERFPFDRQFFKLEIECTNGDLAPWYCKSISSVVKMRLSKDAETLNFFGVCDTPSWQLDIMHVERGERMSAAIMSLGMSRLTGFYISNIAVPCYLIGTGAVLTIAIPPYDYGDRFQCMIALFLTLVAIKFVAQFLPVISYSTLLDHYTLISYMFLAAWMIENFFVSSLLFPDGDDSLSVQIDRYMAILYVFSWTALHVVILVGTKRDMFRKSWKDVLDDDQGDNPDAHKEAVDFNGDSKDKVT